MIEIDGPAPMPTREFRYDKPEDALRPVPFRRKRTPGDAHLGAPLFVLLTAAPVTPELALALANRYGLIGGGAPAGGEPVQRWRDLAAALTPWVDLWTLVVARDTAALARCVAIDYGGGVATFTGHPRNVPALAPDRLAEPATKTIPLRTSVGRGPGSKKAPDLVAVARDLVAAVVGENLPRGDALTAELVRDGDAEPRLIFRATSVPAVAWLGFARAVAEGHRYERCGACDRWVVVGGKGGRVAKFCSSACRMRAHRGQAE